MRLQQALQRGVGALVHTNRVQLRRFSQVSPLSAAGRSVSRRQRGAQVDEAGQKVGDRVQALVSDERAAHVEVGERGAVKLVAASVRRRPSRRDPARARRVRRRLAARVDVTCGGTRRCADDASVRPSQPPRLNSAAVAATNRRRMSSSTATHSPARRPVGGGQPEEHAAAGTGSYSK